MIPKTTRAPCTARRRAPRRRPTTPRRRRPGSSAAASFVAGPLLEKRPHRCGCALDRSVSNGSPPSAAVDRRAANAHVRRDSWRFTASSFGNAFYQCYRVSASTVCACVDLKDQKPPLIGTMVLATPLSKCDHKTELAVCKTLASKRKREKAPSATRRVLCHAYQPRKHASVQRNLAPLGAGRLGQSHSAACLWLKGASFTARRNAYVLDHRLQPSDNRCGSRHSHTRLHSSCSELTRA